MPKINKLKYILDWCCQQQWSTREQTSGDCDSAPPARASILDVGTAFASRPVPFVLVRARRLLSCSLLNHQRSYRAALLATLS